MRWIACDTWIIRIAKKEVCGRAIAIHETLMGAGIACGPLVISMTGIQGSLPFLVCAGIVVSSLIPLYFIKSYKALHEDVIERKKETKSIFSFINIIPVAITSALICGFVETSSISFLSLYAVSFGYAVKSAALFLACFGAGGTLLQIPIGWMADKYGFRSAQKICALGIIITAILLIFFIQYNSIAWISAFVMGGVVGRYEHISSLRSWKNNGRDAFFFCFNVDCNVLHIRWPYWSINHGLING